MRFPIYTPEITNLEKRYVMECLDSTWISSRGAFITRFEEDIASFTGMPHAVSVFNGTVALHLALWTLGIGPGDEVIVPDFTYIATANAVKYVGARPIVVDVDISNWNISAAAVEAAMSVNTKAVLYTDIYGLPGYQRKLSELCGSRTQKIWLIEDAAESLGAKALDRPAGSHADIATLSFFGNKTITTGEGGMVLFKDAGLADHARVIRNQGNSLTQRYYHDVLGHNFRMTNIQAALGCAQMTRINDIVSRKRAVADRYRERLSKVATFQEVPSGYESSCWMVAFLVPKGSSRSSLMAALAAEGIESRPFFRPVNSMPYIASTPAPNTYELSKRGINVPSSPCLSQKDVDYICDRILTHLENFN